MGSDLVFSNPVTVARTLTPPGSASSISSPRSGSQSLRYEKVASSVAVFRTSRTPHAIWLMSAAPPSHLADVRQVEYCTLTDRMAGVRSRQLATRLDQRDESFGAERGTATAMSHRNGLKAKRMKGLEPLTFCMDRDDAKMTLGDANGHFRE